jgi:hypothetical protein
MDLDLACSNPSEKQKIRKTEIIGVYSKGFRPWALRKTRLIPMEFALQWSGDSYFPRPDPPCGQSQPTFFPS